MIDFRHHEPKSRSRFFRPGAVLLSALILIGCGESSVENVDDLLARAKQAIESGTPRAASVDLKTILQKDPENVDARLMLGTIYLDLGDADSARKELEKAQELGADSVETNFLIGRSYLLGGQYSTVLEKFVVTNGMNAHAKSKYHLIRGLASLGRGELDDAETSLQSATAEYKQDITEERPHLQHSEAPEFIDAIVGLTNVSIKRGNWGAAEERLNRVLKISPEHHTVLAAKGELNFHLGKYTESEAAFQAAFKAWPNDLERQIGIARAQIMLKNYDDAKGNLDAVLKYFPDHIVTNYYSGLVAIHTGDYATAKAFGDKILKSSPNYSGGFFITGIANYGLKNFEQANSALRRYLSDVPTNRAAQRLYAVAQLHLSKNAEALSTLQSLAKDAPQDDEILTLTASAAARTGDLKMASDYYQKAVETKPGNKTARLGLSAMKIATGNRGEAIEDLERAVENAPDFIKGLYALLVLHMRDGAFDKALEVTKKLRDAEPDSPNPSIAEGLVHTGKQDWKEALSAFNRAREMAPDHIGAAYGAADAYFRMGDIDGTRKIYDDILKTKPDHIPTLMRYVGLTRQLGQIEESNKYVDRAVAADPKAVGPRLIAAQTLVENNQPLKALSILQDVANDNVNHPELLLVMGRAQLAAGKSGQATNTLERLVRVQPGSPGAHFLLAQAYAQLDNHARARAELEEALRLAPDYLEAAIANIRSLVLSGKNEEANTRLVALKAKQPENLAIRQLEGWVALKQGRPEETVTILTKLLSENNTWTTTNELAVAHWQNKDSKAAIETIRSWVRNNPDQIAPKIELANYLILAEQRNEAVALWENIISVDPENWVILNNLADSLQDQDPEKSLGYAERAYKLNPNAPPVALTLASALLANSREPNRAEKLVASVAKQFPDNVSASILLVKAMLKNGNSEGARNTLIELRAKNLTPKEAAAVDELERQISG